jgi:single-stranded-DNA-specific exonuclease
MPKAELPTLTFGASLSRKLGDAAALLRSHKGQVRIFSHYDPDGIGSAAVACQMVKRLGLGFQVTLSHKLDDAKLGEIRETQPEHMVMLTDMGASKISQLDEFPHSVIVIDHHQPESEGKRIVQLNPHLFGIDGAREASASSFAFALAVTLDEANWDLIGPALAGAVGDRQSLGGFRGYNEDLVIAAAGRELVKLEKVPNLKGGTILESLLEHPEPYFKGITGRKREASHLVKWLGFGKDTKVSELDEEKKRFLASICAMRLLRQGATPEAAGDLVLTRYWLYDWGMYADQLSSLFNSCARQGESGLGLALALGDKAAMEKAQGHEKVHREYILQNLRELEAEPPKPMKHIQHFRASEVNYAGVLAGLGTLYMFDTSKPSFALSEKDGELHVSARAPRNLVKAGLNLGLACKQVAESLGGAGGGHDIAAGATVPAGAEKKFLKEVDSLVGKQLAAPAR